MKNDLNAQFELVGEMFSFQFGEEVLDELIKGLFKSPDTNKKIKTTTKGLYFVDAEFTPEYIKKYRIKGDDEYKYLFKNGVRFDNNLYRMGGLVGDWTKKNYFMILKYDETLVDEYGDINKKFQKTGRKIPALTSKFIIMDADGKIWDAGEKFYLLDGLLPIKFDGSHYVNFITDEALGEFEKHHETDNYYLFIPRRYSEKNTQKGVAKMNKHTMEIEYIN